MLSTSSRGSGGEGVVPQKWCLALGSGPCAVAAMLQATTTNMNVNNLIEAGDGSVETLNNNEGQFLHSWRIAAWGCCTEDTMCPYRNTQLSLAYATYCLPSRVLIHWHIFVSMLNYNINTFKTLDLSYHSVSSNNPRSIYSLCSFLISFFFAFQMLIQIVNVCVCSIVRLGNWNTIIAKQIRCYQGGPFSNCIEFSVFLCHTESRSFIFSVWLVR